MSNDRVPTEQFYVKGRAIAAIVYSMLEQGTMGKEKGALVHSIDIFSHHLPPRAPIRRKPSTEFVRTAIKLLVDVSKFSFFFSSFVRIA